MLESKYERALRKIDEIKALSAPSNQSSMAFVVDAVVWLLKDRIEQLVEEAKRESK